VPRIEPLNPGFSTADAEYPEVRAAHGTLHLKFKDWREQDVEVQFNEVCAFRWQEAESLLPDEPYDGSCELLESEWAAQHLLQLAVPVEAKLRHLRFNFNACGQLEILCTSYAVAA
jgi:hypothetical protein